MANDATSWFVLKITLTSDQVTEAFNLRKLVRPCAGGLGGWRYCGALPLSDVSFEWIQATCPAIGAAAWALNVLPPHRFCDKATCAGCGIEDKAWIGGARHGKKPWCAACWNVYFIEKMERS